MAPSQYFWHRLQYRNSSDSFQIIKMRLLQFVVPILTARECGHLKAREESQFGSAKIELEAKESCIVKIEAPGRVHLRPLVKG